MSDNRNLIAFGQAEMVIGDDKLGETNLAHITLMDDGGLAVFIEGQDVDRDITIRFPASTIEAAVRKRLRGRA